MKQLISRLSKNSLALIAIAGGILLMVIFNPPHNLCDSQMSSFHRAQQNFIYTHPKDKIKKTSQYNLLLRQCKLSNSPGGCYELFVRLKTMLKDLDFIPEECAHKISDEDKIRRVIWDSLDLLVRIAWGSKPPANIREKLNWLEPSDVFLYCLLKKRAERSFSRSSWEEFREKMFKILPGIEKINRNSAWELMLVSVNCDAYR